MFVWSLEFAMTRSRGESEVGAVRAGAEAILVPYEPEPGWADWLRRGKRMPDRSVRVTAPRSADISGH